MPKPEDIRLLALLGLRLKGFASADAVAQTVGADEDEILSALKSAEREGLVSFNEARAVYMLDPVAGRAAGESLLAGQLDAVGGRALVSEAYQAFLELNGVMLQLCTDWQV
ncbi:MAG: transcriptional regulator, partial [bacterium]|nr:transcriptional regulator [bacterium]